MQGVAKGKKGKGRGHTLSNKEYSLDYHVDLHALFYLCINQLVLKWREGSF